MNKRLLTTCLLTVLLTLGVTVATIADDAMKSEQGTWTGEVLDLACYVAQDAHGADHAGCAKTCVKNGQPMGLLTSDGDVVLLAADHKDGKAYEALKDLAGSQAKVTGTMAERGGMKVVTVTGAEAAG